jgi:hypothetical protein
MSNNPFSILPYDVCNDAVLPAFPEDQDCTGYDILNSQISGLIIVPIGANKPTNWETMAGWDGVIDNSDQTLTKGRYIAGIGSFLPNSKKEVSIAGGRRVIIGDRIYRLDFTILNMAIGHRQFIGMLEGGYRGFDCWLETYGGRVIGGADGIRPFLPDGEHRYEGGVNDVEALRIVLDFFFNKVP